MIVGGTSSVVRAMAVGTLVRELYELVMVVCEWE